jgi:UDPglucose 6-dehydrogenase
LSETGNNVVCVDVDEEKIRSLKDGLVPMFEPGLEELVKKNLSEDRLSFTTDLFEGVRSSEVCFIAVGTPEGVDGSADLKTVLAVAEGIGKCMDGYRLIVIKSTVPVGTSHRVAEAIRGLTSHPFDVASNPEFTKEGAAVDDFMKPDRIVVGASSQRALNLMEELYAPFVRTDNPILVMDPESAEMSKYASNALLACKISFINEISTLCERVGADIAQVRRVMGYDTRIGHHFLFPGVGYGGSCFPKDVRALIRSAAGVGLESRLVRAIEEVNARQKKILLEKVFDHFGQELKGKVFAVWGLSFKPRTDDMREAPSLTIIDGLLSAGASVRAYDPQAMEEAKRRYGTSIRFHKTNYEALEGADALVLITEWSVFRRPDFARVKRLLKQPVIFDGRNVYDPEGMEEKGFVYYCIGRRQVHGGLG